MPLTTGRSTGARTLSGDWNRAVGERWARVLRGRGVEDGAVVEVGPGFSDKIAHGLAALGFRGTILLIEPNARARAWAVERYRHLLPHACVDGVGARLQDVRVRRPVDALLANHLLDDLLLEASVPRASSARLFSTMWPGAACSEQFIDTWRRVLTKSPPRVDRVAREVGDTIASMRPSFIAWNQYASWRQSASALAPVHQLSLDLMTALQSRLARRGLSSVVRTSNAMRWLIGTTTHAA